MNYGLSTSPSTDSYESLVIGVLDDKKCPDFVSDLEPSTQSTIKKLLSKLDSRGQYAWQADINGHSLMVIHCGSQEKYSQASLSKTITDIAGQLNNQHIKQAVIALPEIEQKDKGWQVEQMITAFDAACYQLLEFKSKDKKQNAIESVLFYSPQSADDAVTTAKAICDGVKLAKDLANRPANACTPSYLADVAHKLAQSNKAFSIKVLEQKDMEQLGMGAMLAVAKGSQEPPKFIELNYNGGGDAPPVVLVGKGVTFDSGGISIKPSEGMAEMKFDMGGAASVLGTLKACSELNLPLNVIGLMPCTENLPSGTAIKPGDVVTSLSGQTIEILNTDAEGRLILADALTYAERFNPKFVLDIATLTGAMVVALGGVYTGFMTEDDAVATRIEHAANESGDKAWRLPLDDDYQPFIDSDVADIANQASTKGAGSITAACFLSHFTKQYPWAHLDIAGSAWVTGQKCGATGRPVRLLTSILRHASKS
jgi:leucyl aminopeptidase